MRGDDKNEKKKDRIARSFCEVFNLANWQIFGKIDKCNSADINSTRTKLALMM